MGAHPPEESFVATSMPAPGDPAPNFSAIDQHGSSIDLESFAGKWVVLYFYPKDDTPGCTKEACNFRDHHPGLAELGAVVLGVSGDTAASHAKFAQKYDLPFSLLVDADRAMAKAYGAWGIKKNYGREYEGIIRSTFIISPEGTVAKRWATVKPAEHGAEVLQWLKANASS